MSLFTHIERYYIVFKITYLGTLNGGYLFIAFTAESERHNVYLLLNTLQFRLVIVGTKSIHKVWGVTTGYILPIGYSVLLPWIQTSLS